MRFRELSCLVASAFVAFVIRSAEASHFRIVSGRKASTKEFPYQVSLEVKGRNACGGCIIGKNFVLTAAHCVKWAARKTHIPTSLLAVRVGHDVSSVGGTVCQIAKITVHEKYVENASVIQFDIALLKMVKPFRYSDRVKPIELATRTPKDGEMGWVTGFGKQEILRVLWPVRRHLMAVELPIIGLESCRAILRGVADDMICAGHKKGHRDACQGDSGGPLAVNNQLVGIIAWGIGCGREGIPGVYTNVAYYYEWIQDVQEVELKEKESNKDRLPSLPFSTGTSSSYSPFLSLLQILLKKNDYLFL